jgi:hypothetical protein
MRGVKAVRRIPGNPEESRISKEELEEMIGKKTNKLTVIKYLGYYTEVGWQDVKHWYLCKCECGTTTNQTRGNLNKNALKSCGCLNGKKKDVIKLNSIYKEDDFQDEIQNILVDNWTTYK